MRGLRVGAIRYVACASPAYLKRRGRRQARGILEAHDCISFSTLSSAERWSFCRTDAAARQGQADTDVNTAEAAIDAAKAGLGVTPASSPIKLPRLGRGVLSA